MIAEFLPITIQPCDEGGWDVIQDGKSTGALCFGEMLEMVVKLANPGTPGNTYAMRTPEEWEQWRARYKQRTTA